MDLADDPLAAAPDTSFRFRYYVPKDRELRQLRRPLPPTTSPHLALIEQHTVTEPFDPLMFTTGGPSRPTDWDLERDLTPALLRLRQQTEAALKHMRAQHLAELPSDEDEPLETPPPTSEV
jgi:hypothetical protein